MRNIRHKMAKHIKNISSQDKTKLLSIVWYLELFIFFVALIYLTFGQSLHLPLWGDDWEMLWIVKNFYGPGNQFPYLSFKGYAQPWGVMNLFLIVNKHFFGYSGYGYYLVSMVLRTLSAFAGYLFISKFNKSKFIGLIGGLFVLVGYTGIESTNYTIHMNTYLVPMFTFLTLFFLVESYKGKLWKFLLGCVLFALSLAASPLRSHGLLPFIIVFDVLYGLVIAKANFKRILFRQVSLFLFFLAIFKLKFFGDPGLSFINMTAILQMIRNSNYTFITCFITTLGRAYFPDVDLVSISRFLSLLGLARFKAIFLTAFLVEASIFLYISKMTHQKFKSFIIAFTILVLNFVAVFLIFNKLHYGYESFSIVESTLIGVLFLSFLFWAFYVLFTSKKEGERISWLGIIMGPVLILTSLLVPLLHNVGGTLDSNHRYLTLGLSGVAVTFAALMKLSMNTKKAALFILTLLVFLIIINIRADKEYFSALYAARNINISAREWSQYKTSMQKYFQNYPNEFILFYFDDSESQGIANNTFLYGFDVRTALEYNIKNQEIIPSFTDIYSEVVSAVADGKAFLRLGRPQKKINIDQVYAFRIEKNGDLIDITKEIRKDLVTKLNQHE